MKTIVITGSSKGIGKSIAEAAAKGGFNVALNYFKSEDEAKLLQRRLAEITNCIAVKADVSDPKQAKLLIDEATKKFGGVDVLVNNAAISKTQFFDSITDENWRQIFAVNVDGAFYCSRAVMPAMLSRKSGKIVNIASMWGEVGASMEVHYSAAKAALIGFTKALAKEVAPSGIQVNCVSPGCINTSMNACHSQETLDQIAADTPLGRLGEPIDVANAVMFLCSDKADFITGQILSVNGGLVI